MNPDKTSERGFGKRASLIAVSLAAFLAMIGFFARPLRQFVYESLMQRVTSAHYEILCPPGVLPAEAMRQFASQREALFATLNRKLDDAASNIEIRIVFDGDSHAPVTAPGAPQPYAVTGTTVRTTAGGLPPQLDSAADAEALLRAVWGKPGNSRIERWAAVWLVGDWHGEELGMAAARIEQQLGHKKVSALLNSSSSVIPSEHDRDLLGAAWLTEIAQLDGPAEVRKLYLTKMPTLNVDEAAKAIGTTPIELDRKWQMWMYSYLAGMPSDSQPMPMNMQMPGHQ